MSGTHRDRERCVDPPIILPPDVRTQQVILIAAAQVQDLAQRTGRGLLPQPAAGGQLGVRRDHCATAPQVPVPGRHRVDRLLGVQLAGRAQDGGDVAVRQAPPDLLTCEEAR